MAKQAVREACMRQDVESAAVCINITSSVPQQILDVYKQLMYEGGTAGQLMHLLP
jgi:hypothetical protein